MPLSDVLDGNRTWHVETGDALEVLRELPPAAVDAVVTDPPYELGFMRRSWDSTGIAYQVSTWEAVLRALKPGAYLLAFGGSRTYHRMACAVEDAGFEIRDQLMWLYGQGMKKSDYLLKPAHEPILLAQKPLEGTFEQNIKKWGTGAIEIDGCRIPSGKDHADKCASVVGLGSNRNGICYGEWRGKRTDSYNAAGRWPANVLLDEEAARLLDEQSGESVSRQGKSRTGRSGQGWGMTATGAEYNDSGGASRFFYCAKASKQERTCGGLVGNDHPTVKPLALMQYLCRLVTRPDGVVLDPFAGSGSTLVAALREGFRAIGIEQERRYVELARQRIDADCPLLNRTWEAPRVRSRFKHEHR